MSEKLKKMGHANAETWNGWHSCLRNEWEAICLVQKPLINNYIETLQTNGLGLIHAEPNGVGTGFLPTLSKVLKEATAKSSMNTAP